MTPSRFTSVRRGVFAPLAPHSRVDAVEQRLVDAVELGLFVDGEQLPSEAELAARLGVAPVTLREALVGLRRRGLLTTRRGRGGGSFVRAPAGWASEALRDRLSLQPVDTLRDSGDLRRAIEGTAAELAAVRASTADVRRLAAHEGALARAETNAERRRADARFHIELAAASQSPQLTDLTADSQAQVGPFLWFALEQVDTESVIGEHRAVLQAVASRDPARARELAVAHVERETRVLVAHRLDLASASAGLDATTGLDGVSPDHATAEATLNGILEVLDEAEAVVTVFRDEVSGLYRRLRESGQRLARPRLGPLRTHLRATLGSHGDLIVGAGVVFDSGVLEDELRWLEWWRPGPTGAPVLLGVSLDPQDPEFYDYETAEWFAAPRETGERWIVGPFVDYSGTNEHIFTLTVPIIVDDHFLGVAGIDMTVARIEALSEPGICAVDRPAVIVNHHGRVVASNRAEFMVGTLFGDTVHRADGWTTSDDGAATLTHSGAPWSVVLLGNDRVRQGL